MYSNMLLNRNITDIYKSISSFSIHQLLKSDLLLLLYKIISMRVTGKINYHYSKICDFIRNITI